MLSENLATLLNTQRIEKYPWALTTKVDYQVEVDVQRFETTSDGQSQLIASWIIRDGHERQNPLCFTDYCRSARGPRRAERVVGVKQRSGNAEQGDCLARHRT